jgi:general L-amino acid transport system permease protein
VQDATGVRPKTWWKSLLILFGRLILLLWALGFHWATRNCSGFNFQGGIHMRNSLIAMWLGAGHLHRRLHRRERARRHPRHLAGQTEAAFALGLRRARPCGW